MTTPEIYTKDTLITALRNIRDRGWIQGTRPGNAGSIGNTLEDLLGIQENNLPLPNAAEWELKCQRLQTSSLTTLFHLEPSPTALKFVSNLFLPYYGWDHQEAGKKYPVTEKSFRQTISTKTRSDRGFKVVVDTEQEKILISFDALTVSPKHQAWLQQVDHAIGLGEINPQPYWGFDDFYHKAATKLHNCFFVGAMHKKINGIEHFHYTKILMLKNFSKPRLINAIESADILVDFDARTGHNHGTKFRFRNNRLSELYDDVTEL